MEIEHEAKVLAIDPERIADRIIGLGGTALGKALQRRFVYDVNPPDPNKWIRLREAGGTTTLTVKEIHHDGIDGTREAETMVGGFEEAADLLAAMGYTPRGYQENHRESFRLGTARLEIDRWPLIPPYLEIEADSRRTVLDTAGRLGFGTDQLTSENTTKIYARYGIDLNAIADLRFAS